MSETDICDQCGLGIKDTFVHALCDCKHTKSFLKVLFERVDPSNLVSHSVEGEQFLFGV